MPTKPKLGQNFLNDTDAIQRIAASLGDLSGRTVVEIGPGAGAITGALAARAAHVMAVELDSNLAAHLRTEFPSDRVTVINQDVLHFDFAAASASAGQRLLVAGNLPYGITSQILLRLAASHAVLDRAVLMVQREVADRIAAPPGSRDYGLLSVTVQLYGSADKLFTLPPSAFTPPPTCTPRCFAGVWPRASWNSAWKKSAFCASCARFLRRSERPWPIISAPQAFQRRPSPLD